MLIANSHCLDPDLNLYLKHLLPFHLSFMFLSAKGYDEYQYQPDLYVPVKENYIISLVE